MDFIDSVPERINEVVFEVLDLRIGCIESFVGEVVELRKSVFLGVCELIFSVVSCCFKAVLLGLDSLGEGFLLVGNVVLEELTLLVDKGFESLCLGG